MHMQVKDDPYRYYVFRGRIDPIDIGALYDWLSEFTRIGSAAAHVFDDGNYSVIIREDNIAFAFRMRWS